MLSFPALGRGGATCHGDGSAVARDVTGHALVYTEALLPATMGSVLTLGAGAWQHRSDVGFVTMTDDTRHGATAPWFAENLRAARERAGISQGALNQKMLDLGYKFHQQTVSKIEAGDRKVDQEEAYALAGLLGTTVEALRRPPDIAIEGIALTDGARQLSRLRQQAAQVARQYGEQRALLEALVEAVEAAGHSGRLAREVDVARRVLASQSPVESDEVTVARAQRPRRAAGE